MDGMPAGFYTAIDTLSRSRRSEARTSPQMADGADGAARLVFKSAGRRRTALLRRWPASAYQTIGA